MKTVVLGAGASAATLGNHIAPISPSFGKTLNDKIPAWKTQYPFISAGKGSGHLCVEDGVWLTICCSPTGIGIGGQVLQSHIVVMQDPTPYFPTPYFLEGS